MNTMQTKGQALELVLCPKIPNRRHHHATRRSGIVIWHLLFLALDLGSLYGSAGEFVG